MRNRLNSSVPNQDASCSKVILKSVLVPYRTGKNKTLHLISSFCDLPGVLIRGSLEFRWGISSRSTQSSDFKVCIMIETSKSSLWHSQRMLCTCEEWIEVGGANLWIIFTSEEWIEVGRTSGTLNYLHLWMIRGVILALDKQEFGKSHLTTSSEVDNPVYANLACRHTTQSKTMRASFLPHRHARQFGS